MSYLQNDKNFAAYHFPPKNVLLTFFPPPTFHFFPRPLGPNDNKEEEGLNEQLKKRLDDWLEHIKQVFVRPMVLFPVALDNDDKVTCIRFGLKCECLILLYPKLLVLWFHKPFREPCLEKSSNWILPNSFSTPPPSSKRNIWGNYFRRKLVNSLRQWFWLGHLGNGYFDNDNGQRLPPTTPTPPIRQNFIWMALFLIL